MIDKREMILNKMTFEEFFLGLTKKWLGNMGDEWFFYQINHFLERLQSFSLEITDDDGTARIIPGQFRISFPEEWYLRNSGQRNPPAKTLRITKLSKEKPE